MRRWRCLLGDVAGERPVIGVVGDEDHAVDGHAAQTPEIFALALLRVERGAEREAITLARRLPLHRRGEAGEIRIGDIRHHQA